MTLPAPRSCLACSAPLRPVARFCSRCGAEAPIACPGCNAPNEPDANFCELCGTQLVRRSSVPPLPSEPRAPVPSAPVARHIGSPERRQTTIMFCDLVDSTALSGRLDPEDLREVLHAFRDVTRAVIARHDGFVASYMGDGALVLFAYPRAHEDDPQRAVRAGLELVSAIGDLVAGPGVRLRARVGIATGLVVIGPLLGAGVSLDEVVVGQVTNLAARLQALAGPSQVVISDATRRLVEEFFFCVPMGEHSLKGFDQPVTTWLVRGERSDHDALNASSTRESRLPLVARRRELEILSQRWQAARSGSGQLVVIQGEPGVGKSKLVQALRERVSDTPHSLLRYACAQRFQDSVLFPVIRQIERAAGLRTEDSPDQKLDRLEAFVLTTSATEMDDARSMARLLAAMLAIPFETRYAPIVDSPERQREHTFACLKRVLFTRSADVPVLMVVEDVHWADPTTLELVNSVLADMNDRRILLVATVRPGYGEQWPRSSRMTAIELQRLTKEESAEMVRAMTQGRGLSADTVDQILRKSEGIPLFIEELTKTVIESPPFQASSPSAGSPPNVRDLAIPSTLQDSLAARLDSLSPVKEVAQVAAAIGREFEYELLALASEIPESELRSALRSLCGAELVYLQNEALGTYTFKHALLQDAAYNMMVRSTRQTLHQRIALAMETRAAAGRSTAPDVLAHHWIEGGEPSRALPYMERAARLASASAAHTEARRQLTRALDIVHHLPPGKAKDEHELRLSIQLGLASSAAQGYASPEVETAYRRALELCRTLGDSEELFPAMRGLCTFHIVRAALEMARQLGEDCLRLSRASGRPADEIDSATGLGYTLIYQGALAEGDALLATALELYTRHEGERLSYPSLQDPAVASLALRAIVQWMFGNLRAADELQRRALELAERLNQPFNRAYVHAFAALLENVRFRYAEAMNHANAALEIADRHGFAVWSGAAMLQATIADGNARDPARAIPVLLHVLGLWKASGAELSRPFFLWGLARCQRGTGELSAALRTTEDGIEASTASGEVFLVSELHRFRAELLYEIEPTAEAPIREALERALDIARAQGAVLLELRALRTWCTLWPRASNAEAALMSERARALRAAGEDDPELDAYVA